MVVKPFKLTALQKTELQKLSSVKKLLECYARIQAPADMVLNGFFENIEKYLSECIRSNQKNRIKVQLKARDQLAKIEKLAKKLKNEFEVLNKVSPYIVSNFSESLWENHTEEGSNKTSETAFEVYSEVYSKERGGDYDRNCTESVLLERFLDKSFAHFGKVVPINPIDALSTIIQSSVEERKFIHRGGYDDELKALYKAWKWCIKPNNEVKAEVGHDFMKMCCIVLADDSSYTEVETVRRLKRCEWWIDLQ